MMKRRTAVMKKLEGCQRSSSTQVVVRVRYAECRKNHAASMGGYAVDGCREFIAAAEGEEALVCAACGCHRNFHRREVENEAVHV